MQLPVLCTQKNAPVYSFWIPNQLLLKWHALNRQDGISYLELLNRAINNSVVTVDIHCKRLKRRIATAWLRGRAWTKQLEKTSSFDVHKRETVSASQVLLELEKTMEEVEERRSRCCDAEATNLALTERLLRWHMSSRSRSRSPPPQPGRVSEDAPPRLGKYKSRV